MTWKLSRRSKDQMLHVHPDLGQFVANLLLESPVDFAVTDGLREKEEQRQLVRMGASRTMKSRHLMGEDGYAHAVDLAPYYNGKLRWEWEMIYPLAEAARRVSLQIEVPIRWGGVWDRRLGNLEAGFLEDEVEDYVARRKERYPDKKVFIDGAHFELPRIKCYR
jgi:peptidoglycan L-alanyl-D-glutamate endopeptidase CwlK